MGNLCSSYSSSNDDGYKPNRKATYATDDPPRTLGSGNNAVNAASTTNADPQDAKRKAAEAAEARAAAAAASKQQKGKLATQLQKQKKQTRTAILESLSEDERKARELDERAEAQKYM